MRPALPALAWTVALLASVHAEPSDRNDPHFRLEAAYGERVTDWMGECRETL